MSEATMRCDRCNAGGTDGEAGWIRLDWRDTTGSVERPIVDLRFDVCPKCRDDVLKLLGRAFVPRKGSA